MDSNTLDERQMSENLPIEKVVMRQQSVSVPVTMHDQITATEEYKRHGNFSVIAREAFAQWLDRKKYLVSQADAEASFNEWGTEAVLEHIKACADWLKCSSTVIQPDSTTTG